MNDINNAIEDLKELKNKYWESRYYDCIKLAISSLEKQIPKEVKPTEHNYFCPTCDEALGKRVNKRWELFCPHCGQALLWMKISQPTVNT
jgi:hypothetical protein